ncbi:MAG: FAD-dependent oxidoreductase [Aminivibrio sp.]|jgi:hypothetical protein
MDKLYRRPRYGRTLLFAAVMLPVLFLFIGASPPGAWASVEARLDCDVLVAGGGAGGVSAAISAARLGARVILLEETDWLGGQMTAAGVSTMDDLSGNKTGIYGEFYEKVRFHYFMKGKSISTCYWDGSTVAFEPSVGRAVLEEMAAEASREGAKGGKRGGLNIFYRARVTAVRKEGPAIREAAVEIEGVPSVIACKTLIDATEHGDVIPLAGALYRAGNSISPMISSEGRVQDITWTAVIKKYPSGIPAHLRMTNPPPGYERYLPAFRKIVAKGGNSFRSYPLKMPVDFATHNGYRGLPDSSNPENYDASGPDGWAAISKTGINWGNDFPGTEKWEGRGGLPSAYLEDGAFRARVEGAALLKTLSFIYYIQHELGEPWSVTDDEYHSDFPLARTGDAVPAEYGEIVRRFPPIPYVRESRRIVGLATPTSSTVRRNSESYRDGNLGFEVEEAVAIGGYILDLHAGDKDRDLEAEFGETADSIKSDMPRGPFQVPFGSLVSRNVDGLLAAEKNISMSRLVAGAFRLQPISMLTGQAAGVTAALSALAGIPPAALDPGKVQRVLLEQGSALSLCEYSDVPRGHPFWPAVQMSNLRGWLSAEELPSAPSAKIDDIYNNRLVTAKLYGLDKGVFGVESPITGVESEELFRKAFSGGQAAGPVIYPGGGAPSFVTRGEFCASLARAAGYRNLPRDEPSPFADISPDSKLYGPLLFLAERGILEGAARGGVFMPDSFVTKGAAADMVMRAVTRSGDRFLSGREVVSK